MGRGRARYSRGYVSLTRAGNWQAHWFPYIKDFEGKERRTHKTAIVGTKARMRKFEAENELHRLAGAPATSPSSTTVQVFIEKRWKPIQESEWRDSTRTTNEELLAMITAKFGNLALKELDRVDLQTWLNDLAQKRSRSCVWHLRTFLKSITAEAVEQDYLVKDPARKLKRPITRPPDETVLDWVQYQKVLTALPLRDQLIVKVAGACAVRPEELFAFRWKCRTTLTSGRPALCVKETVYRGVLRPFAKTEGSLSCVSLPFRLSDELDAWRETAKFPTDEDFIFANTLGGFILKDNYLNRVLYPVRDALALQKLNFQVLRRTFATRAYGDRRGTLKDVQKHLRHARASTSMDNYIKEVPDSVSRMVDAMYDDMVPLTKVVQ